MPLYLHLACMLDSHKSNSTPSLVASEAGRGYHKRRLVSIWARFTMANHPLVTHTRNVDMLTSK